MSDPPAWMESSDRRILAVLARAGDDDRGYPLSVRVIASETGYEEQMVAARCDDLSRRGLLDRVGPDSYRIQAAGREYVADADESPVPEPLSIGPDERPGWMERGDLQILDAVRGHGGPIAPADVADDLGFMGAYVKRRCRRLAAEGLLQPVDAEVAYTLRDLGTAFLDGDVDAEKLESPGAGHSRRDS